ncbi:MAG: hypothetical protein PHY34_04560 [Patescibacteria group bacterium]|nr:hypothetical protein [Patescibacteria group bacterium]
MQFVLKALSALGAQPGDTISFTCDGEHTEGVWISSDASSIFIRVTDEDSPSTGTNQRFDGKKIDSASIELVKSGHSEDRYE